MNARILFLMACASIGVMGWIVYGRQDSRESAAVAVGPPAEAEGEPARAPALPREVEPQTTPAPVAPVANRSVPVAARRAEAPASGPVDDERAVLDMYTNMADAVDAYGPNDCAGLGRAFGEFVADGSEATARLLHSGDGGGGDVAARFQAAHASDLEHIKSKMRDALARCGKDPGLMDALRSLAKAGGT